LYEDLYERLYNKVLSPRQGAAEWEVAAGFARLLSVLLRGVHPDQDLRGCVGTRVAEPSLT
jgi:hypothetical protein